MGRCRNEKEKRRGNFFCVQFQKKKKPQQKPNKTQPKAVCGEKKIKRRGKNKKKKGMGQKKP